MLSGYKTYIVAAVMGLATSAKYMGWIDEYQLALLMSFLASFGLAALRAGVKNDCQIKGE